MITRVCNLILAGGIAQLTFGGLLAGGVRLEWSDLPVALVLLCWVASAIGLFTKSRLAWYGSLLGVGAMAAGSITSFYTGWSLLPVASDPTDGIGYMLLTGILGLVLSLPLIIGLICIRKTCFAVTP